MAPLVAGEPYTPPSSTDGYNPAETLPIWSQGFTRNVGNPLITTADTGTGGTTAADPYLHVINDKLYVFFESTTGAGIGQDWMAESTDGVTWTNFVQVSTTTDHYAHPVIYEESGTIHLYMQRQGGKVAHRSSPVSGFPDWSAETIVFESSAVGWSHFVEFEIFKHSDNKYYLLGITADNQGHDDQLIRGLYADTLPTSWHLQGSICTPDPMADIGGDANKASIIEIARMQSGGRLVFYFGVSATVGGGLLMNCLEVDSLSPTAFTAHWHAPIQTWTATQAWESGKIHHAHAVEFGGQWVVAYDGDDYKIGLAVK